MKHAIASLLLMLVLSLQSCTNQKGPLGRLGDEIDDATDSRPAEGIQDAVEDLTKD